MITTLPYILIILFFFNDTATTEIYTLSLHDALPICQRVQWKGVLGASKARMLSKRIIPCLDIAQGRVVKGVNFVNLDRKSTRLNSSHANISYAVFCLKKKNNKYNHLLRHHLPIPHYT